MAPKLHAIFFPVSISQFLSFNHSSQVGGFGLVVLRLEKMTRLAARFLDYAMSTTFEVNMKGTLLYKLAESSSSLTRRAETTENGLVY